MFGPAPYIYSTVSRWIEEVILEAWEFRVQNDNLNHQFLLL